MSFKPLSLDQMQWPTLRWELTDHGREALDAELRQMPNTDLLAAKEGRIIDGAGTDRIRCAPGTEPQEPRFTRECYDWWRDGCNCTACNVINSWEKGESSYQTMRWRMALLCDLAKGHHGDGVELPRMQLQIFARRAGG